MWKFIKDKLMNISSNRSEINMSGGHITINGTRYEGKNIVVENGTIIIDGTIKGDQIAGPVNITVNGNADSITTGSGDVTAGDVGKVQTGSGDIECGNVSGNVQSGSGDVSCKEVHGKVQTGSGDIIGRHG